MNKDPIRDLTSWRPITVNTGSVLLLVADGRLSERYDIAGWLRLQVDDKWVSDLDDQWRIDAITIELEKAGWIGWPGDPHKGAVRARLTASGREVVSRAAHAATDTLMKIINDEQAVGPSG